MEQMNHNCYNVTYPDRKVYNNQEIFTGLKFNLSFIEDSDIREKLKLFYWNWSMAYPDKNYMNVVLQNQIDMSKDYWEDMAKTYRYDYDPLVNLDLTEERSYKIDEASSASQTGKSTGQSTNYEKPYDYNMEVERGLNTNVSQGTSDSNAGRVLEYTETTKKYGDASLRTIPEFIKIERSVIDSLITSYIYSFKNLFYLDI